MLQRNCFVRCRKLEKGYEHVGLICEDWGRRRFLGAGVGSGAVRAVSRKWGGWYIYREASGVAFRGYGCVWGEIFLDIGARYAAGTTQFYPGGIEASHRACLAIVERRRLGKAESRGNSRGRYTGDAQSGGAHMA